MPPTLVGREYRCLGELRAADNNGRKLVGYAAVYNQLSQVIAGAFRERVLPGAFARALRGEDDVRALFDHESCLILGRSSAGTLRLSDDAKGLAYEIDVPETTAGNDLLISVRRGDISQSSFGFRTLQDNWSVQPQPDGTSMEIRDLISVQLFDISPVAFPAYDQTEVSVRSVLNHRREAVEAGRRLAHEARSRRLRLAQAEV